MDRRVAGTLKVVVAAGILLATCADAAASQQQTALLYRMVQGGTEVGRESYRASPLVIERSVTIPLLNLRQDSRTEFAPGGAVARFTLQAYNAAGDSLRGSIRIEAHGDSILVHGRSARGEERTAALRGPIDAVIPGQSVSIISELIDRAAGRDTVFRVHAVGTDTVLGVTVRFRGARAEVSVAGMVAMRDRRPDAPIEIPVQRIVATPWNGVDSLPPLPGLLRPRADYSAPPGAPYTAQDFQVPIRMSSGDTFSLAGTLTLPSASRGRVPVVVTISGSGRQPRDEDLWPVVTGYRPFRDYAERLAREGIGVFRFADRGVDGSTGGNLESTTADHAEEVRQIVAWLRSRSDVDPRRIALLGHSEGGIIGPLVAVDDPAIAAVVILAGPAQTGEQVVRYQLRRNVETAPGLSDSLRQAQLALVEEQVQAWLRSNAWTRWFATYDPLTTARRLRQPVLIQHGALDRQVTVEQAEALAAAIRSGGNRDVTVRVYPRLNHLFLPTDGDGSPSEYATLRDLALPAQVLDDTARWLSARLLRR
ncbi:MAG TPA: alpha/beta fold hydrolase [Gemmatimonadales bacterium]|nr:alpha/beta fold hydrolase [Gemmatimonadales bacterium]